MIRYLSRLRLKSDSVQLTQLRYRSRLDSRNPSRNCHKAAHLSSKNGTLRCLVGWCCWWAERSSTYSVQGTYACTWPGRSPPQYHWSAGCMSCSSSREVMSLVWWDHTALFLPQCLHTCNWLWCSWWSRLDIPPSKLSMLNVTVWCIACYVPTTNFDVKVVSNNCWYQSFVSSLRKQLSWFQYFPTLAFIKEKQLTLSAIWE